MTLFAKAPAASRRGGGLVTSPTSGVWGRRVIGFFDHASLNLERK